MNTLKFLGISLIVSLIILSSCNKDNEKSFAYGNFESEDILVPAENSGILVDFLIREGSTIREGQKIGQTDTLQLYLKKKQMEAALKAVISRLDQINAEIRVQEVQQENIERDYKRFGTLFLEEAATKKQLDDLEGQIEMTWARIGALNSQKLSVYAERDAQNAQILQLEDQINRSVISAPAEGQVLETFVKKGEMAVAGRPVAKIANLSELILRVFIDGDQLSSIKTGDRVKVLFDGPEDMLSLEGTVTWISPEAEFTPKIIQTREERVNLVYAVKVLVINDGTLKIGMPGEIQLIK